MTELSNDLKRSIYKILRDNNSFIDYVRYNNLMNILSDLWDVYNIPQNDDERYKNTGENIQQHFINNIDYSSDEVFINKLHLLDNDDKFIKFTVFILNNAEINNSNYIIGIRNINDELEKYNLVLLKDQHNEYKGIYKKVFLQSDITDNEINFYVINDIEWSKMDPSSHEFPPTYPSFVLVYIQWDDYGTKALFNLYYFPDETGPYNIGKIKILNRDEQQTIYALPHCPFIALPDSFASLGQDTVFYTKLHDCLKGKAWSVLKSLNDIACFHDIDLKWYNHGYYKCSLLRKEPSQRAKRLALYIMEGYNINDAFHFTYHFKPKYSEDITNIDFHFEFQCNVYKRIIGIIGENGVGKTTLLNSVPKSLAERRVDDFKGILPLFSKYIVISFSPFDSFDKCENHKAFDYVYCGLMKSERELLSRDDQCKQIIEQYEKIKTLERERTWYSIIKELIGQNIIDSIVDDENGVIPEQLLLKVKELSSGQLNYLYAFTSIIANIRFDSLLLFDEPEQHLHPRAITMMMNRIFKLLENYESYAIIGTHSPLVIRELISDNVYILRRDDDSLFLSNIQIESFGEDISVLNDEIFGDADQKKRYEAIIDEMANSGKTYEQILSEIESKDIPLGLKAKLYIRRSIIKKRINENT